MQTFADKILYFLRHLSLTTPLPKGIRAMNPYQESNAAIINEIAEAFYQKYYKDSKPRQIILGINPGRLGAGATGLPFTDTKRLEEYCDISSPFHTHEPSSVFIYDMIAAFGGPTAFYQQYYISSVSPLGFVKENARGNEVNFNYYDDKTVEKTLEPFILSSLQEQLKWGIPTHRCVCFGTGKNYKYLQQFNKKYQLFDTIIPLEHPRYIMQYKAKSKQTYIDKYLRVLS